MIKNASVIQDLGGLPKRGRKRERVRCAVCAQPSRKLISKMAVQLIYDISCFFEVMSCIEAPTLANSKL